MIEILILYILYKETNTLYGIRKNIKERFLHLNSGTFGSIHPAVGRLIEKGFLQEKRTITSGGRKKNIYSITKTGQNHIIATLNAEFSSQISNLEKQISIKLACCDILEEQEKNSFYLKVIRYYEHKIMIFSKMVNNKEYNELQKSQLKNFIAYFESEIELIKTFL